MRCCNAVSRSVEAAHRLSWSAPQDCFPKLKPHQASLLDEHFVYCSCCSGIAQRTQRVRFIPAVIDYNDSA